VRGVRQLMKRRLYDFLPSGLNWGGNVEIRRAWVDLRPEDASGDRNMMMVMDIAGAWRTLFYFPENTVLVKWEEPC